MEDIPQEEVNLSVFAKNVFDFHPFFKNMKVVYSKNKDKVFNVKEDLQNNIEEIYGYGSFNDDTYFFCVGKTSWVINGNNLFFTFEGTKYKNKLYISRSFDEAHENFSDKVIEFIREEEDIESSSGESGSDSESSSGESGSDSSSSESDEMVIERMT